MVESRENRKITWIMKKFSTKITNYFRILESKEIFLGTWPNKWSTVKLAEDWNKQGKRQDSEKSLLHSFLVSLDIPMIREWIVPISLYVFWGGGMGCCFQVDMLDFAIVMDHKYFIHIAI